MKEKMNKHPHIGNLLGVVFIVIILLSACNMATPPAPTFTPGPATVTVPTSPSTSTLVPTTIPTPTTISAVTYDSNGFFHLDSGESTYVGYKPDTYRDAKPISLFVWMHGCGGTAEGDMWTIAPYSSRETQSYIAISIGGRDNDCWSVDADGPKVLAAIADVSSHFNINPRKIYLGGYSSGGDMTYRLGLQNASLFAGLLVENSDPFKDTGVTQEELIDSASWKINIAHLSHLSDDAYPIDNVRAGLDALTANGFPVTKIEKVGSHYDPDNGASGTDYDLAHFLLPFLDAGWESPASP
jgi:predicted esterase